MSTANQSKESPPQKEAAPSLGRLVIKICLLVLAIIFFVTSGFLFYNALLAGDWLYFAFGVGLTWASALCIRLGTGFPALSALSIAYALLIALLSLVPISYFLFPPPADPVGASGMGAGMVITILAYFAPIIVTVSLLSLWAEKRGPMWYVLTALLYSPIFIVLAVSFTGIVK